MKIETRTLAGAELRSITEEGEFEGYIAVWNTIDSYNSSFDKRAFDRTIKERGSRVKVFYNHSDLIGSSVSMVADDKGLLVRGKLNLNIEKAKEAYEFMKDGTLEGLSFGFRTIKEKFVNGVRTIMDLDLYEYGPVVFPANDAALIQDVRATDFDETVADEAIYREQSILYEALYTTIQDIWYSSDSSSVVAALDDALAKFHASYLDFASRWVARFWDSETRSAPGVNSLAASMAGYMEQRGVTAEQLAMETEFTLNEIKALEKGALISRRELLATLSPEVVNAHREARNSSIEKLCLELRDKLSAADKLRINSLLGQPADDAEQRSEDGEEQLVDDMMRYLETLKQSFNV